MWPTSSPSFLCLADAFGVNYFDGNFRFASMCGKNDFPQPNGMLNGLGKCVPQYLAPRFLPGRGRGALTVGFRVAETTEGYCSSSGWTGGTVAFIGLFLMMALCLLLCCPPGSRPGSVEEAADV